MKFAFYTLGCKVNQFETQAMEQELRRRGHVLGTLDERCDGYIINTCTVTAVSDRKCRSVIRRLRRLAPEAVIGVCGCYVQVSPDAVRALGVDVIAGTAGRMAFLDLMEQAVHERGRYELLDDALRRRTFETLPAGGMAARTRAMLKVQDGCSNFCSYCIIPYARGPVRSEPLERAVSQARALAEAGYRELVATGIEISSWGRDLPGQPPLHALLTAICAAVPQMRVRLGSLEPRTIDAAFCQALAPYSNLCPQFHLSLQSGCDTVLARMRRKYDTARYRQSVAWLRETFPGCAITTDLIVAFPGETEEEFAQTLAFVQEIGFAAMHIFPYSRRSGTPAAAMPGQLSNAVKQARASQAGKVAEQMQRQYEQGLIGTVQQVLFEQPEGAYFTGHAPNYVKVAVPEENLHNQVRAVRIVACEDGFVRGELAE